MSSLNSIIMNEHERIIKSSRDSIDNSSFRKIETLDNGDKFVHDLSSGYIIDGATGQIKGWSVKDGRIGGPSQWLDAGFRHNGVIGPGGDWGLYPNPPVLYR